jgi:hypothetical protein
MPESGAVPVGTAPATGCGVQISNAAVSRSRHTPDPAQRPRTSR